MSPSNHTCKQEANLSALSERVSNQQTISEKLEEALKGLLNRTLEQNNQFIERFNKTDRYLEQLKASNELMQQELTANRKAAENTENAVKDLTRRVTAIETDLRTIRGTIGSIIDNLRNHGLRLSLVEKWVYRIATITIICILVITGLKDPALFRNLFFNSGEVVPVKESVP